MLELQLCWCVLQYRLMQETMAYRNGLAHEAGAAVNPIAGRACMPAMLVLLVTLLAMILISIDSDW